MIGFIYGTYKTSIDSSRPKGIICPNCKGEDQIVIEKCITVFHIMYIPFFSSKITNVFTCKSCDDAFDLRGLPTESKQYFEAFKSKKKKPIWLFSGPLLILLLIGVTAYNRIDHENEMLKRLKTGNKTQIIEYETEDKKYSSMKTLKITVDSVWLLYNQFEIENYQYINRITGSDNYSSDTTIISIESLKQIIDDGKVRSIYPSR
jgi:hypothetical protein